MYELEARLTKAGCDLNDHETDLYVRDTPIARAELEAYEREGGITNRTMFRSELDGRMWWDLPFHHDKRVINHWFPELVQS